mmetsp:Transcript_44151/g.71781  ORF Transcript_44151/g.71781 Transcript_44151/m.71781 type:complete len:218 (-) Transcript_44151:174-827(-)
MSCYTQSPSPPTQRCKGGLGAPSTSEHELRPASLQQAKICSNPEEQKAPPADHAKPHQTRTNPAPAPQKSTVRTLAPHLRKKRFVKSGPAAVCTKGAGVMQHQPTENRSRQIHGPQLKVVGSNNSCHLDVTLSAQRGPVAAVHQRPTPLLQTVPYHIEILTHPPHRNSDPGLKQPLRAPETAQGNFPLAFTACAQTDHHRGWHDLKKRRNGGATLGA